MGSVLSTVWKVSIFLIHLPRNFFLLFKKILISSAHGTRCPEITLSLVILPLNDRFGVPAMRFDLITISGIYSYKASQDPSWRNSFEIIIIKLAMTLRIILVNYPMNHKSMKISTNFSTGFHCSGEA